MELYEILQVDPDCSMANIKKSYYNHPFLLYFLNNKITLGLTLCIGI